MQDIKEYNRIPDFKTYLTETIWGRSMSRALGDDVRKEDDLSGLNKVEFISYIMNRYIPTEGGSITGPPGLLFVPFIKQNALAIDFHTEGGENRFPKNSTSPQSIWFTEEVLHQNDTVHIDDIKKRYNMKFKNDTWRKVVITPKDGEMTNNKCIEIVDFLLNSVKHPLCKINS